MTRLEAVLTSGAEGNLRQLVGILPQSAPPGVGMVLLCARSPMTGLVGVMSCWQMLLIRREPLVWSWVWNIMTFVLPTVGRPQSWKAVFAVLFGVRLLPPMIPL